MTVKYCPEEESTTDANARNRVDTIDGNIQKLVAQDLKRQLEIKELRGLIEAQNMVIRELQEALVKQNERLEKLKIAVIRQGPSSSHQGTPAFKGESSHCPVCNRRTLFLHEQGMWRCTVCGAADGYGLY